jgi:hypothetical protein
VGAILDRSVHRVSVAGHPANCYYDEKGALVVEVDRFPLVQVKSEVAAYLREAARTPGASFGSVAGNPTIWVPLPALGGGRLDATKDGSAVTIWIDKGVANPRPTADRLLAAVLQKL